MIAWLHDHRVYHYLPTVSASNLFLYRVDKLLVLKCLFLLVRSPPYKTQLKSDSLLLRDPAYGKQPELISFMYLYFIVFTYLFSV